MIMNKWQAILVEVKEFLKQAQRSTDNAYYSGSFQSAIEELQAFKFGSEMVDIRALPKVLVALADVYIMNEDPLAKTYQKSILKLHTFLFCN